MHTENQHLNNVRRSFPSYETTFLSKYICVNSFVYHERRRRNKHDSEVYWLKVFFYIQLLWLLSLSFRLKYDFFVVYIINCSIVSHHKSVHFVNVCILFFHRVHFNNNEKIIRFAYQTEFMCRLFYSNSFVLSLPSSFHMLQYYKCICCCNAE